MTAERRLDRRSFVRATAAAAIAGLAGCANIRTQTDTERRTEERVLALEGADAFELTNDVGRVSVIGADRSDVQIRIVKQATPNGFENLNVETARTDETISVFGEITDLDEPQAGARTERIDLMIEIPRSLTVREVASAVGEVSVRDVVGDLTVRSSVGQVEIQDIEGYVDVRGGVDEVTVDGVTGVDRVTAGVGRVDVAVPAIRRDARIETDTGDIELAVAPDLGSRLQARANTGEVSVDELPLTVTEETTGGRASGELGGAEHTLTVRTGVGKITIQSL